MNTTDRILGESVRPPTKRELTDPEMAFGYAKYVLKGRFPEAEPAIAKDPTWAEKYLIRFPESKLEWRAPDPRQ